METKTCNVCKKEKHISYFISKTKRCLKLCFECRSIQSRRNQLIQYVKCEHDRQKNLCKDCGTGYCEHGGRFNVCKICCDPIKITIYNMIYQSKYKDQKKNRYDPDRTINYEHIREMADRSTKCHYCNIDMQFLKYQPDMCTIERLDNSLGHIIGNCVLACRTCNFKRVGQR